MVQQAHMLALSNSLDLPAAYYTIDDKEYREESEGAFGSIRTYDRAAT